MTIIANIDLCEQRAARSEVFSAKESCPEDCVKFVNSAPGSAFKDAYWEFGGW